MLIVCTESVVGCIIPTGALSASDPLPRHLNLKCTNLTSGSGDEQLIEPLQGRAPLICMKSSILQWKCQHEQEASPGPGPAARIYSERFSNNSTKANSYPAPGEQFRSLCPQGNCTNVPIFRELKPFLEIEMWKLSIHQHWNGMQMQQRKSDCRKKPRYFLFLKFLKVAEE